MTAMNKALPLAGIVLLTGGLCLLAWVGWMFLHPEPAPYAYVMVKEGEVGQFPDLGLDGEDSSDFKVRKYEIRVEGADEPAAVLHIATQEDSAPILLDWRSLLVEPAINESAPMPDTVALARAVRQHAPADAVVLAWWDISRRLKLLAGARVLFDRHLSQPLLIPEAWLTYRDSIAAKERAFWKAEHSPAQSRKFEQFVDALLSDEQVGTQRLRDLAGGRETFLVLNLRDAYRLGVLRPDQFGIGFKDFPKSADVHGLAATIKQWLRERDYESYTIQPMGDTAIRVYFLTARTSPNVLLARLLPFTTSDPMHMEEVRLVYQKGNFWIYRLAPEGANS